MLIELTTALSSRILIKTTESILQALEVRMCVRVYVYKCVFPSWGEEWFVMSIECYIYLIHTINQCDHQQRKDLQFLLKGT